MFFINKTDMIEPIKFNLPPAAQIGHGPLLKIQYRERHQDFGMIDGTIRPCILIPPVGRGLMIAKAPAPCHLLTFVG